MKKILKKTLKESGIYSLEPILKKFIAFLLIPLYTAYLTPADYGQLEYIITITSFFMIIASGGLQTAFFKYGFGEEKEIRKKVLFNTVISSIIISFLVFIIAFLLKNQIFKNQIISLFFLIYLAGSIINNFFGYNLLVLRYQHKAKKYVIISIINFTIILFFNILLLVYFKMGIKGIIVSNLVSSLLTFLIFSKLLMGEIIINFNFGLIKKLLKFSLPMIPGNIAALIMTMSDRYFLEKFSSFSELGLYSYGYKFGMLINILIIVPFFMGWGPYKWEVYKQKNAKNIYKKMFLYLSNSLLILVVVFNFVLTLLGTIMTSKPEFANGLIILPLILGSYYFVGITNFQAMGVLFKNKTYLVSVAIGIAAVLNLFLNWLLIPKYGMLGASIATMVSYFIYFIIYYLMNQKYYHIDYNMPNLLFNIFTIILFSSLMVFVNYNYKSQFYIVNLFFVILLSFILIFKFKKEVKIVKMFVFNKIRKKN